MLFLLFLSSIVASTIAQEWTKLPGAAVEISAKGDQVWVVNNQRQVFRWNGADWDHIPGQPFIKVAASPDGWAWAINTTNNVFRYNVDTKVWDFLPGILAEISAMSRDRALGIAKDYSIWVFEKDIGTWKQMPGGATSCGIGDGDERWVVNEKTMQIFRWNHATNVWDLIPGGASYVDVQNPCRVIVSNIHQQMFLRKNNAWIHLPGAAAKGRAGISEKHFFAVNDKQEIYRGEFKEDHFQCPKCEHHHESKESVTVTDHHHRDGDRHRHQDVEIDREVVVIYRDEE
jgi:hypothetical protein